MMRDTITATEADQALTYWREAVRLVVSRGERPSEGLVTMLDWATQEARRWERANAGPERLRQLDARVAEIAARRPFRA